MEREAAIIDRKSYATGREAVLKQAIGLME